MANTKNRRKYDLKSEHFKAIYDMTYNMTYNMTSFHVISIVRKRKCN